MTWYERNQQRRRNRGEARSTQRKAYQEGYRRRTGGWAAIVEKKSGEIVCVAKNGCFGRLKELDRDLYESWAQGTSGASF